MSINLSNDLVKIFIDEVHQVFQESGILRDTCRMKIVKGDRAQFPVLGQMITQERTLGTKLPIQNKDHTPITIITKNFTGSAMVDNFLQNQVNFDDRQETAKSLGMALGRRLDQLIIDALVAASAAKTVPDDVSGAADNLTVSSLRRAAKLLNDDGVPTANRFAVVSSSGLEHLLEDSEVTSSDFNTVKALVNGEIDTYMGFKFKMIGTRVNEGGLPIATNARTSLAFHKDAIGCTINMDMTVNIDRLPEFDADLVTGKLSANAGAIDNLGIVEITTDES